SGYLLLGPQLQRGAIVYDHFTSVKQLVQGIIDTQNPGEYSTKSTDNQRFFSWASAAQSLKPLCFSPRETLWKSKKTAQAELTFQEQKPITEAMAIIGAKACDLAGLALQDQHFLQQEYIDPYYEQRRNALFIVAVDCSHPATTCFCASTGDGPAVSINFDIRLSELDDGFIVTAGSQPGQLIVDTLQLSDASSIQLSEQARQLQSAVAQQTRSLPDKDVKNTLKKRQANPHWKNIGEQCLACGNCTATCPSCFCHSEHDESPLGADQVSHVRQWDSCFNQDHSYIHGIVIRAESKDRYRQWMTHKFSSWIEQYGRSGCTGCGRCITWCPVGIDVTKELAILCASEND
ncbi:MAG TPA: sulfite reductase subunit A, partial [Gammaproteobacteria bacterium]|nr:sulfite reductase subunit A [Gammaproteobacteria bacterium]